jgi:hypothetical protein
MTLEEMLEGAKCSCGHLWIADHFVSDEKAGCRRCSCVLELWDQTPNRELTIEQFEEMTRRMKEGEE